MWHRLRWDRRVADVELAGMIRVWVIATVLSTVIATIGVQEIAARVTSPLHLDGRSQDGGTAGVLALNARVRTSPAGDLQVPAPMDPGQTESLPQPVAASTGAGGSASDAEPSTVNAPSVGWEIVTAAGSGTRWARGNDGPDGEPEHHLQFVNLQGRWEYGYGNNAATTLTTPWIEVPSGDGVLSIAVWSRMYVEPDLDGYILSWSDDDANWHDVATISGGQPNDPVKRRTHAIGAVDANRVRVRLSFTSDEFGSAWDRDVPPPALANGEHLDVNRIAIVRAPIGRPPIEDLGVPHRSLEPAPDDEPHVVLAVGGESINPYHPAFRDRSPRAYAHPSTYIEGYPQDAVAVWLSLDASDFATAMRRDEAIWEVLTEHQLYWFPGTRIVGAVTPTMSDSLEGCQPICIGVPTSCTHADQIAPEVPFTVGTHCHSGEFEDEHVDRVALPRWSIDATHWAAAAAGTGVGTCEECLLVHVDSIGASGFRWPAAHADWIDVQVQHHPFDSTADSTANWGYAKAVEPCGDECAVGLSSEVQEVSARQLVVTNPETIERADPLYEQPLAGAPGAVTVAAHDGGYVTWPEPGSHVAVNHCAVLSTADRSFDVTERGVTLRMSTTRAAGLYADALLRARRLLGDLGHGDRAGALAIGTSGDVLTGPLADGRLTMDEWRRVVEATATPRPPADPRGPRCHDGASPDPADDLGPDGHVPPGGPGTPWSSVPDNHPAHTSIGYGAIDDPRARSLARDVLGGTAELPERSDVDAWFVVDNRLRIAGMQARAHLAR